MTLYLKFFKFSLDTKGELINCLYYKKISTHFDDLTVFPNLIGILMVTHSNATLCCFPNLIVIRFSIKRSALEAPVVVKLQRGR